jgi:serine phosphatase RsbU (regulator of sigma subunit)
MQELQTLTTRHPLSLPVIKKLARSLLASTDWKLLRFDQQRQPIGPETATTPITALLPITVDGVPVGYLGLAREGDTPVDVAAAEVLLESLAELINGWLSALQLASNSDNELSSLIEITRLLTSSVNLSRILGIVCEAAARSVEAKSAVLWLMDEDHRRLHARSVHPNEEEAADLPVVAVDESPIDLEALGGDPVVVEDVLGDPRTASWPESIRKNSRSAMVVGLIGRNGPLGTLHVHSNEEMEFSIHAIHLLTAIANQAAACIDQATLEEDIRARERLANEVAAASQIQSALLPRGIPSLEGLELAVHFHPSRDIGGDLYDLIPLAETNLGLAIGDASGKSVTGALMMAMVRGGLHAYVEDVFHITDILSRLNRAVHEVTFGEHFMTLFYGVLNLRSLELTYTNAGHNAPLLFHDGRCTELVGGGLVLGADPDSKYTYSQVKLHPGDIVVFYTDGLSESIDGDGNLFHRDRIRAVVRSLVRRPAQEILDGLLAAAHRFRNDEAPHDDLTAIVLRVKSAD